VGRNRFAAARILPLGFRTTEQATGGIASAKNRRRPANKQAGYAAGIVERCSPTGRPTGPVLMKGLATTPL